MPLHLPTCDTEPYIESYDSVGDGKIDRCYNPADKIKDRVKVDDPCKDDPRDPDPDPPVKTPSTEDAAQIKAAAKSALDLLNNINSDLAAPSAENKSQLDALAAVVGIADSASSDFVPLKNALISISSCLLPKLDDAMQNPEAAGYRVKSDPAARKMEAQTCKVDPDDERRIEISAHALDPYVANLLPMTLIHENQHICGSPHEIDQTQPDFYELSKKQFEWNVAKYHQTKAYQTTKGNEDSLRDLFKDPTYLEYLLEAYQ